VEQAAALSVDGVTVHRGNYVNGCARFLRNVGIEMSACIQSKPGENSTTDDVANGFAKTCAKP
jgi:hypothetical protein